MAMAVKSSFLAPLACGEVEVRQRERAARRLRELGEAPQLDLVPEGQPGHGASGVAGPDVLELVQQVRPAHPLAEVGVDMRRHPEVRNCHTEWGAEARCFVCVGARLHLV